MEKIHTNSIFKILLVLCLSFTLLLSQTSKMHMHLVHNDHAMLSEQGSTNKYVLNVHPKSMQHDVGLTDHYDHHQSDHSANTVDIHADKLLNKANLFDHLVFILLFIYLFLYSPRLRGVERLALSNIPCTFRYYLLRPPLRAPPLK